MIIGLTGTKASGKGAIADILQSKGFAFSSTSDRVREEAVSRGLNNYKIKDLQDIGNELRDKNGLGVLVNRTLEKLVGEKNCVIDGIRNLGEVERLRSESDFYLIGVDASLETRYQRLVQRARSSDPKDWEGFLAMNKRDLGIGEQNTGQQVGLCLELADYLFTNDYNSIEELTHEFVEGKKGFLNLFGKKRIPHWDEQFMRMSYEVGNRSKCLRRNVGAVLVKDNVKISDGYNGPARGAPHCEEKGGCLRAKLNIPSGQRDEICRAIHGEINAILNAETRSSRQGAKMYVNTMPCSICSKIIANSGIEEVIYFGSYPSELSEELLKDAKIKLTRHSGITPGAYPRFWG